MRDSEIKTLFAKADEQVHVDEIRKQKTYHAMIDEMEKQRTPNFMGHLVCIEVDCKYKIEVGGFNG